MMKLTEISIENFKKIRSITIPLSKINYLVGGNNSGKSSILQAIHCAVTAAQSKAAQSKAANEVKVLAEENLIYAPSSDFSLLGHERPFENPSQGHRARINFFGFSDDGAESEYKVELYKGRNARNVGIETSRQTFGFGSHILSQTELFSVFVPGLAGVIHNEEFKTEAYVFRKIAGGEANLYLRNVLMILKDRGKFAAFLELARELFPDLTVTVKFDPKSDIYIDAKVKIDDNGTEVPIDLVGTGVLQALQIFAYATLANPAILLLDEPDSHLHPSNQVQLLNAFEIITTRTDTKIILATHSRHLINSAPEEAALFWVRDGMIRPTEDTGLVKLMMEIGALDDADAVLNTTADIIMVTEDHDQRAIKFLLESSTDRSFKLVSINGAANTEIAREIITQISPYIRGDPVIILHRDRDFMTEHEVQVWKEKFESSNIKCFVTKGSDVESYFIDECHLASISGHDIDEISAFIHFIIREHKSEMRDIFKKKRKEINIKFHADGGSPLTGDLLHSNSLPGIDQCVGKNLVKKIRCHANEKLGKYIDPICKPATDLAPDLTKLIRSLIEGP